MPEQTETPRASFLFRIFISLAKDMFELMDEEESINNVYEDLANMLKYLEEHPELDKEMGSRATNYISESKKAHDLGIDLNATLTQDEDTLDAEER